jgi:hypothetical protein
MKHGLAIIQYSDPIHVSSGFRITRVKLLKELKPLAGQDSCSDMCSRTDREGNSLILDLKMGIDKPSSLVASLAPT